MNIDEIKRLAAIDLKITEDKGKNLNITGMASTLALKSNKYHTFLMEIKKIKRAHDRKLNHKKSYLTDLHMGVLESSVYKTVPVDFKKFRTKSAAVDYIELLPVVEELQEKADELQDFIDYIKGVITIIHSLGFTVKNIISWERYKNGESGNE